MFKSWSADNIDASVPAVLEQLRSVQTVASLRPSDRPIIFMGACFTERCVKNEEAIKHKAILAALAATHIQQRHLIAAAEWVCGTKYPNLLKFFPVMLKQFYDEDLVDEDVFFEWDADSIRNDFSAEITMMGEETLEALRGHAKQFIIWLREAEEDDEDDGEEEGDDEGEDGEEED